MTGTTSQSWRGYLIDHHWPPEPCIPLDRFLPDEFERRIRSAHIDNLVVYCKDHWGCCYYPTSLGLCHPAIRGDHVGAQQEILQRLGVAFVAYYSVGFDEHAARTNPQWIARGPQGELLRHPRRPRPRWHRLCLETGYLDFVREHLVEILSRYRPPRLFLDILGHPPGTFWGVYMCYCERCRHLFRERYGFDPPEDLDGLRARAYEIEDFKAHLDRRSVEALLATVKGVLPDIDVGINGAAHFRQDVRAQIDWQFTEPFWGHWRSALFMRGVGRGKFLQGGAEVGSAIYDPMPAAPYRLLAAANIAQGVRPMVYSPSQRPDGRLDKVEFQRLGSAYGQVEAFETHLSDRSPVPCIGILYHERTCVELPDVPYGEERTAAVGLVEADRGKPDHMHRKRVGAAIGLGTYAQMPVDVLTEQDLTAARLGSYRVLVLPGASRLEEDEAHRVREFVRSGGSLIVSCDTGLRRADGSLRDDFLLADVMGLSFESLDTRFATNQWGSYLVRQPHEVWRGLPQTSLPLPPPLYVVRPCGAETWACHLDPCGVVGDEQWISWWSPPPGRATRGPVVTHHRFGRGQVVYFAASPFADSIVWVREGFSRVLAWLMGPPPIRVRTSCPGALGSSFWRRDRGDAFIVHLVNLAGEHLAGDVLPLRGASIEVDPGFAQVRSARQVFPRGRSLEVKDRNGVQSIRVPPVEVHAILSLAPA